MKLDFGKLVVSLLLIVSLFVNAMCLTIKFDTDVPIVLYMMGFFFLGILAYGWSSGEFWKK